MMDFDPGNLVRNHFAAGAAGGFVGLRLVPGATLWGKAGNVLAGSLIAGYVTPAVVEWYRITSAHAPYGIAFALGLFGLSLAAELIDFIKSTDFRALLSNLFTRKKD